MDDWRHRILQALRDSQLLLLVLSPSYLASEYCQWEIVEYLKYEHARAAGGQGVAPVYFVEVPDLDSSEFTEQAADWVAQIRRRNHFDLRPWCEEGKEALKRLDVAKRLEDLEQTLYRQISKLRRVAEAQGNLASHNPYFVGRETEMQQLHEATGLGRLGSLSVIQGVGGLGKTALAIQYAYAYADFYPGGRWLIPCAGKLSLASAIRDLSIDLGLSFEEAEKENDELAAKRVLAELERRAREGAEARADEKTPPQPHALVMLDNAEVGDMLQPPQTDLLSGKRWLHVVATTRMSGEDFGYDPDQHNLLAVDELPLGDAVRLIERHQVGEQFPNETERRAAEQIAELLGGFTLAVEVVANHLGERRGRVSCADFLQRLRKEGFDRVAPDARRSVRHGEKLVSATLEPTLALLKPEESLVLACAALLPPDLIPLPWLRPLAVEEYPALGVDAEPGYDDPWIDLVNHLLGLRLLQVVDLDPDTGAPRLVRMHRLSCDAVRTRNLDSMEHCLERLIFNALTRSRHLEKTWFEPEYRWEIEPLISFVDSIVTLKHEAAPRLVKHIGQWHAFTGDLERTESLHRGAIEILQSREHYDELELAILSSNLGGILQWQGRFDESENYLRHALEIDRRLREPDHEFIPIRLINLGLLLQAQGKRDEAEPMLREALDIRKKVLSPDHPDIATSLITLASLQQLQGKLDEAEPMFREGLDILKKSLPPNHPDIATSLISLASLMKDQGKFDEAESLLREALDIYKQALSPGHLKIAINLNNLAGLLQSQGKLDEAEPMFRDALDIYRKALPAAHPDIAMSLNNLSSLLKSRGKLDEAETIIRDSLDIYREALPGGHPDIAIGLNNLGALLYSRGKLDEAEPLMREALDISRNALPAGHADIAVRLHNLASLLQAQGKTDEVEEMYCEALDIMREAQPDNHLSIAATLQSLALLLQEQGRLDQAESRFREALDIQRKALPPGHQDTVLNLNDLALILRKRGAYHEAANFLQEAIEIEEGFLTEAHPKRPHRWNNLAMVLMLAGDLDNAADVNAGAWKLKCDVTEGGHDVTSARILIIRTALAWLTGITPDTSLGQLKTLLARAELPVHGNIDIRWDVTDVLDRLRSLLPEKKQTELLGALVEALNEPSRITELDKFPLWRDQPQLPLEAPLLPASD